MMNIRTIMISMKTSQKMIQKKMNRDTVKKLKNYHYYLIL